MSALAQHGYRLFVSQDPPAAGIYLTAEDYLNFRPNDTAIIFQHIAQMEGDGVNNFYRRNENGKKGARITPGECFAASDGKTFYISYANEWHKAKKIDSEYYFIAAKSRLTKEELDWVRIKTISAHYGSHADTFVPAEFMQDNYKMKFSLLTHQWIYLERIGKKLK